MDFRDRIRALMEERGLTAATLSREAGLNVTYVRDLLAFDENGKPVVASPRYEKIAKLAAALGTTAEFIMEGRNPEAEPASPATGLILEFVRKMPETSRAQLAEIARTFVREEKS